MDTKITRPAARVAEKTTRPAVRISDKIPRPRGFAAMAPVDIQRIASAGCKASQAEGKCHKWIKEEAQAAGRKGGLISK